MTEAVTLGPPDTVCPSCGTMLSPEAGLARCPECHFTATPQEIEQIFGVEAPGPAPEPPRKLLYRDYDAPKGVVMAGLLKACGQLGYRIDPEASDARQIVARTRFTLWTWGQSLVVTVVRYHDRTRVLVRGRSRFLVTVLDWRETERTAKRLFKEVRFEGADRVLAEQLRQPLRWLVDLVLIGIAGIYIGLLAWFILSRVG